MVQFGKFLKRDIFGDFQTMSWRRKVLQNRQLQSALIFKKIILSIGVKMTFKELVFVITLKSRFQVLSKHLELNYFEKQIVY